MIDGSTLPNADNSSYMGKLVDAFNWYILCVIDYKDAASLKVGGKITVEFTGTTAEPLSADVVKSMTLRTEEHQLFLNAIS